MKGSNGRSPVRFHPRALGSPTTASPMATGRTASVWTRRSLEWRCEGRYKRRLDRCVQGQPDPQLLVGGRPCALHAGDRTRILHALRGGAAFVFKWGLHWHRQAHAHQSMSLAWAGRCGSWITPVSLTAVRNKRPWVRAPLEGVGGGVLGSVLVSFMLVGGGVGAQGRRGVRIVPRSLTFGGGLHARSGSDPRCLGRRKELVRMTSCWVRSGSRDHRRSTASFEPLAKTHLGDETTSELEAPSRSGFSDDAAGDGSPGTVSDRR